jgi:hypothetical protein
MGTGHGHLGYGARALFPPFSTNSPIFYAGTYKYSAAIQFAEWCRTSPPLGLGRPIVTGGPPAQCVRRNLSRLSTDSAVAGVQVITSSKNVLHAIISHVRCPANHDILSSLPVQNTVLTLTTFSTTQPNSFFILSVSVSCSAASMA